MGNLSAVASIPYVGPTNVKNLDARLVILPPVQAGISRFGPWENDASVPRKQSVKVAFEFGDHNEFWAMALGSTNYSRREFSIHERGTSKEFKASVSSSDSETAEPKRRRDEDSALHI